MKYHPRTLLPVLLALWLTPLGTLAREHPSGIIGQTYLGEFCDFDGNCVPNFVPMNVAIYSDDGRLVADLSTDDDGRFQIILNPGTYILIPYFPKTPELFATAWGGPIPVTIRKKKYTVTVVPYYPYSQPPDPPPIIMPPPPSPPAI